MVETTPPSVITLNVCIALSLKYANAHAFLGFKLPLVFLSAFSAFEELLHSTCYRHQKRSNKHLMHLHAFANRLLSVHVEKGFWSEFCSRSCLYIFLSSHYELLLIYSFGVFVCVEGTFCQIWSISCHSSVFQSIVQENASLLSQSSVLSSVRMLSASISLSHRVYGTTNPSNIFGVNHQQHAFNSLVKLRYLIYTGTHI